MDQEALALLQTEVDTLITDAEDELDRGLTDAERDSLIDELLSELDDEPDPLGNAQPKSKNTGKFKPYGAGTGRGEIHEAAQSGNLNVTDRHRELAESASGTKRPTWAADEGKWEKAKGEADKCGKGGDSAYITAIYDNLGGLIANASPDSSDRGEDDMDRKGIISWLTANCDCWKDKDSAEVLNKFTDDKLKKLRDTALAADKFTLIVNRLTKTDNADGEMEAAGVDIAGLADFMGIEIDPKSDPVGFIADLVAKLEEVLAKVKPSGAAPAEAAPVDEAIAVSQDAEEEKKKEEEMATMSATGNRRKAVQQPQKPATLKQFEESMPEEARSIWNTAKKINDREKLNIVKQLTANISDHTRKQAKTAWLMKKPLAELQEMADLLPPVETTRNSNGWQGPDYLGAAGSPVVNDDAADDLLDLPEYNAALR